MQINAKDLVRFKQNSVNRNVLLVGYLESTKTLKISMNVKYA